MNLNQTYERIRAATFAALVIGAILILILDATGSFDAVSSFFQDPLSATMGWVNGRVDAAVGLLAGPRDLREARAEIEQLQAQVAALQRENEVLREVQGEYVILQQLFERAREAPELSRLTAQVVARDTSPVFRSLIIDKGHDDGVFVGMPVESARGLVGQVYRTTAHSAQVLLITDNISSIPARLGASRATGILRGGGLGGSLSLEWIDLEAQIAAGEVVLTSGLGGKFPQDLVIGRVVTVEHQEAELFQRAIVQPAAEFDSLEILFVITDFRAIDTSLFDTPPQVAPVNP